MCALKSRTAVLLSASVFFGVFGALLITIRQFSTPIPFWDEWAAIGLKTYKPWLEGNFTLAALFSPHNEHRMILPKIVSIILLELNGTWDTILQSMVNALFIAVLASALWAAFFRQRDTGTAARGAFFMILVFSLPYAWENTIYAMGTVVCLLILLSVAALWLIAVHRPLSPPWLGGLLLGFLSIFAQSSGVFFAGSALAVLILSIYSGRKFTGRDASAALLLLLVIAAGFFLRVDVPWHSDLKVSSFPQMLDALARNLAWPVRRGEKFFALVMYLPVTVLFLAIVFRKQPLTPLVAFVVALASWTFLQSAAMAYMRGAGYGLQIESRYTATFVLGCISNAAASCMISENGLFKFPRIFAPVWCALFIAALINCGFYALFHQLPERKHAGEQQIANVRAFMETGDIEHLKNKPFLQVPFPEPEVLAGLLKDPVLRTILPPAPGRLASAVQKALSSAEWIFLAGLLVPLFLVGITPSNAQNHTPPIYKK